MPWKYYSDDNFIEVIVDPHYQGDILALASARPVWIVDSPQNGPRIASVWATGTEQDLFEVSRCTYNDPDNRLGNLLDILGCLDDHHRHHHVIVHGLDANAVRTEIEAEGVKISELMPDGFVAVQDAAARDRLTGRG